MVLERLPTSNAREQYLKKRREERGRPRLAYRHQKKLFGNIKDGHEDEVAEWVIEDDVSNYHTFTVPYGPKFDAKRIEKLCYTRDLLLNAEWNQPEERNVYLHRHPAFFGRVEDVILDCCGSCPKPRTPEEIEISEKESRIYVSGKVTFRTEDPGRQQIGSFNPLSKHTCRLHSAVSAMFLRVGIYHFGKFQSPGKAPEACRATKAVLRNDH